MEKKRVAILMSTYNGQRYINEQIESIINQTYKNWNLYIRDDGSQDDTVKCVENFTKKDSRIHLVKDNFGNLGVKKSFFVLLNGISSEYYMFSDQDDKWFSFKVELSLKRMQNLNNELPCLVHTNLTLTDENLRILKKRAYSSDRMDELNRIIVTNGVTGCTVLINKAMKSYVSKDKTEKMVMHDWWMGLCAAFSGEISYIDTPTIFYRQHMNNQIGADYGFLKKFFKALKLNEEKSKFIQAVKQISAFKKLHSEEITGNNIKLINAFLGLNSLNSMQKIRVLKKYKYKKNSFLGNVLLLFLVFSFYKSSLKL